MSPKRNGCSQPQTAAVGDVPHCIGFSSETPCDLLWYGAQRGFMGYAWNLDWFCLGEGSWSYEKLWKCWSLQVRAMVCRTSAWGVLPSSVNPTYVSGSRADGVQCFRVVIHSTDFQVSIYYFIYFHANPLKRRFKLCILTSCYLLFPFLDS